MILKNSHLTAFGCTILITMSCLSKVYVSLRLFYFSLKAAKPNNFRLFPLFLSIRFVLFLFYLLYFTVTKMIESMSVRAAFHLEDFNKDQMCLSLTYTHTHTQTHRYFPLCLCEMWGSLNVLMVARRIAGLRDRLATVKLNKFASILATWCSFIVLFGIDKINYNKSYTCLGLNTS